MRSNPFGRISFNTDNRPLPETPPAEPPGPRPLRIAAIEGKPRSSPRRPRADGAAFLQRVGPSRLT